MKQEKGLSTSFFANPFGPMQRQEECRVLIDRIFDKLYEEKIPGGEVYTNLGLPDKENHGIDDAKVTAGFCAEERINGIRKLIMEQRYFMKAFLIIFTVIILILLAAGYFFFRFSCKVHGGLSFDGNGKDPYHDRREHGKKFLDSCHSKDVWMKSDDGLKLHGLFIKNKQADKIVLCAHGYRGSAYGDFAGSAEILMGENCDLLLIDERGCGQSDGEYITFGVKEKKDILCWLKWLRKQTDLPVYLYGVSMGSSAVCLCADQKQIAGIIADCGYCSAYRIMTDCCRRWFHIPGYPMIWFVDFWSMVIGHAPLFTANVKKALGRSSVPVLFLHGTKDDFVLPEHAEINYEACSSEKKKLVWIEGAGHAVSSLHDPTMYQKALHEFFMETMQKEEI